MSTINNERRVYPKPQNRAFEHALEIPLALLFEQSSSLCTWTEKKNSLEKRD